MLRSYKTGAQIIAKFGSHMKILGPSSVTLTNFHNKDSEILGPNAQNLVARGQPRGDICSPLTCQLTNRFWALCELSLIDVGVQKTYMKILRGFSLLTKEFLTGLNIMV